jgi:hypothetical protein
VSDQQWGATGLLTAVQAADEGPAPGSVVGLIPAQRSQRAAADPARAATLVEWHSEPGGLTVVADVSTDDATIDAISGQNVWGSFSTPAEALLVVAAVARERAGTPDILELTGVRMLAYEPRRRSARAGLARRVRLRSGGRTHEATTLDLSRGGCRVFTRHPGDPRNPGSPGNLAEGYALEVAVELTDGHVLETAATVVRADGPELALRFTDLAATEAAQVDAAVFRELVRVSG